MAYRVITQDGTVTLEFSTLAAVGQAPVYTGGANILTLTGTGGTGQEVGIDQQLQDVDMAGIGDQQSAFRAKRGSFTISIKKFVLSTGCIAMMQGVIGALTGSKLGFYCKVSIKELSSLSTPTVFEGLVVAAKWNGPDDAQVEEITIKGPAEHQ